MRRLLLILLAVFPSILNAQKCHGFSFVAELNKGERLVRDLGGGLALQFRPDQDGWYVEVNPEKQVTDANRDEYIWPFNPPYHFNPEQDFQKSYDNSAERQIRWERSLAFVLNADDYKRVGELIDEGRSFNSEEELEHAKSANPKKHRPFVAGGIHYRPLDSRYNSNGDPQWIKFEVLVVTPLSFKFPKGTPEQFQRCAPVFKF